VLGEQASVLKHDRLLKRRTVAELDRKGLAPFFVHRIPAELPEQPPHQSEDGGGGDRDRRQNGGNDGENT
jgi:hypothetical protein